jgi:hypothetical protein
MQFFRLTHAEYETDWESARRNPVGEYSMGLYVPTIVCEVCGRWGSSINDRLRIQVPEAPEVLELLRGFGFFPRTEWPQIIEKLATSLAVPPSALSPGMEIGPPSGSIKRTDFGDFVHLVGIQWVKPIVVDVLRQHGATGVKFVKVNAVWDKKVKDQPAEPPDLWELYVTGQACRADVNREGMRLCELCGREGFPEAEWIKVDDASWDGSDFFNVDKNPVLTIVTERVRDILAQHEFTNYECVPVPYPVKGPSWR